VEFGIVPPCCRNTSPAARELRRPALTKPQAEQALGFVAEVEGDVLSVDAVLARRSANVTDLVDDRTLRIERNSFGVALNRLAFGEAIAGKARKQRKRDAVATLFAGLALGWMMLLSSSPINGAIGVVSRADFESCFDQSFTDNKLEKSK
jgi:hypothetical protein